MQPHFRSPQRHGVVLFHPAPSHWGLPGLQLGLCRSIHYCHHWRKTQTAKLPLGLIPIWGLPSEHSCDAQTSPHERSPGTAREGRLPPTARPQHPLCSLNCKKNIVNQQQKHPLTFQGKVQHGSWRISLAFVLIHPATTLRCAEAWRGEGTWLSAARHCNSWGFAAGDPHPQFTRCRDRHGKAALPTSMCTSVLKQELSVS